MNDKIIKEYTDVNLLTVIIKDTGNKEKLDTIFSIKFKNESSTMMYLNNEKIDEVELSFVGNSERKQIIDILHTALTMLINNNNNA